MAATGTARPPSPWGRIPLRGEGRRTIELGSLVLELEARDEEVRIAHRRRPFELDGPAPASSEEDPGELDWSRWATSGWDGTVELVPALPDRLVVVEPEDPFHLLEHAEARIFVRVALHARVQLGSGADASVLVEQPTLRSSDTWFGSVEEGELGYWLYTRARREVTDDLFLPFLAMCPLQLVNRAEAELGVEKIALRVEYLSLYHAGPAIWADETRVRYHGDADGSRLEMAGTPPAEATDATLWIPPRRRMGRGFRARTVARIFNFQPGS